MRAARDFATALYNIVSSEDEFSSAQKEQLISMASGLNYDVPVTSWGITTFYDPKQWAVDKGSYDKLKLVLDCEDATDSNSRGRAAYSGDAFRMAVNKRSWRLAALLIERRGGPIRQQRQDAAALYQRCYVAALDDRKNENAVIILQHGSDLIEGNRQDQINKFLKQIEGYGYTGRAEAFSLWFNFIIKNELLVTSITFLVKEKMLRSLDYFSANVKKNVGSITEKEKLEIIKRNYKSRRNRDLIKFLLNTLDNSEEIPSEDVDAYGTLLFTLVEDSGRYYNIKNLINSGALLVENAQGMILLESYLYYPRYLEDIIEAIKKTLTQENVVRFQQALGLLISRGRKSIYPHILKLIEVLEVRDPSLNEKKTLISKYNAHPDASSYYQFVTKYLPEFQNQTKFVTSILLKSLRQEPSILFASSNEDLQTFYDFAKQFFQKNETELTPRLRKLMLPLAVQQKDDEFLNRLLEAGVNSPANCPTHPILAALEGDNYNALEALKAHGFNLFQLLRPNMSQNEMHRLGEALEKIFKENSENSVSYLTFFVNELVEHPELVKQTAEDAIFFYNMILYHAYENNLEDHVSRIIDSDNIHIKGMLSHALLYAITRNERLTKNLLQKNIDVNNEEKTIEALIETNFGSYYAVVNKIAAGKLAAPLFSDLVFQLMDSIKVSEQEGTLKVDKFEYLVTAGWVNSATRNHENQTILDNLIGQKKWDLLYSFISHRDDLTQDERTQITQYSDKMLLSSSDEIDKPRFKLLLGRGFISPETQMQTREGLIGPSILETLLEKKEWRLLFNLISAHPAGQNPSLAQQYGKFLFKLIEAESGIDDWQEGADPNELAELLLQSGADKTVKNSQGQTLAVFMASRVERGYGGWWEVDSLDIFSGFPTDAEDKAGYLIGCRQVMKKMKDINKNAEKEANSYLLDQAMILAKAASALETAEWKEQRDWLALAAILLHQPKHLEFLAETDASCFFKDLFSNQNDVDEFINHILEDEKLEHLESYLNFLIQPLINNIETAKSDEAIQFYKTLLISFYQKGLCRETIQSYASAIVDEHPPLYKAILMAAIKEEDTLGFLNFLLGLNPEPILSKEEFIETLLEAKTLDCFKLVLAHLEINAPDLAATLLLELQNNLIPNCSEESENAEAIQSNKLNFLLSREHAHPEEVATILNKMREHKLWKSILILVEKFPATENPALATIYGELLFDYLRKENEAGVRLLLEQGADVTVTESHAIFRPEETKTVIESAMECDEGYSMLALFAAIQPAEEGVARLFGKACLDLLEDKEQLLPHILRFTLNCMSFDMPCWQEVRGKVLHQVIKMGRDDDLRALLERNINPNTPVMVKDKERTPFQLALLLNKRNSLKLLLEHEAEPDLDWLKACETPNFWEKQGYEDGLSREDCLMEFVSYVNANSENLEEKFINFVRRLNLFNPISDVGSVSTYRTAPEFGIFAPAPLGRGSAANSSDGTENSEAESELSLSSEAASM